MAAETHPRSPPSPWSAIPLDPAGLVLRLLPAYADRARFAAVRPQWRAAAQQFLRPQPPLPLLALPDGTFYSLPYTEPFRFPGFGFAGYNSVCGNWLVFTRDDGCFLVDPFSRATVRLPPLSAVRLRPPNAVAKYKDGCGDPHTTWMHQPDKEKRLVCKLILCSPNLVAALVANQILMCQPGSSSWSVRAYDECKIFEDMAFYQGKLYAIANDENLLVVNISQDQATGDPQVSRIGQVIRGDPWYTSVYDDHIMPCKKIYLVETRGELLMICRKIWCVLDMTRREVVSADENEFEVFKADFERSSWVEVMTLGDDQVVFLGRRCSRAVSASHYGLKGDRIFFLDDDEENRVQYAYDEEDSSCGAYDMRYCQAFTPYSAISWKRGDEMRLAAWLFPHD